MVTQIVVSEKESIVRIQKTSSNGCSASSEIYRFLGPPTTQRRPIFSIKNG